jgi:hypothetical protein
VLALKRASFDYGESDANDVMTPPEDRTVENANRRVLLGGQAPFSRPVKNGGARSCDTYRGRDLTGKYATALRLGTAQTEALLRRFTRNNVQHPTYKALAELGKAVKTIFLCRYLHSEALRREINEGLNIVEQWNGATDFVFFAKRGEFTSNRCAPAWR